MRALEPGAESRCFILMTGLATGRLADWPLLVGGQEREEVWAERTALASAQELSYPDFLLLFVSQPLSV